jgi:hypothetical protein
MGEPLRRHAATIAVSAVTSLLFGAGGAVAIVANAHKVDGYHADELARVAYAQTVDDALLGDGSTHNVVTTSIQAPAPGYLVIRAGSDVVGGTDTGHRCFVAVDGFEIASSARAIALEAGDVEENCSTEAAWAVGAGRHKVSFRADPGSGITYDEATLIVTYVPFGPGGEPPTP